MPSKENFLSSFHLTKNTVVGGYNLSSISVTEKILKRYYHYQFHATLTFRGGNDENKLRDAIKRKISQSEIVYGTRDPYRCTINTPTYTTLHNGTIQCKLIGNCIKVCQGSNCLNRI